MQYLHFLKYNGGWYYFFSENDSNKDWRPWLRDGFIRFANGCSKTEAKRMLEDMFPGKIAIHTILYHAGPRKPSKDGSRPKKFIGKINRDIIRKLDKKGLIEK